MSSQQEYSSATTDFLSSHQSNRETFNSKRLNYEEERIKSFTSWPVHYPVDPDRLAKAGFYYTGTEDEVVCFSCQGHIKHWNYGDIVLKKHTDLYPNCDFIKNLSNNVPLSKTSIESRVQPLNRENYSSKMQSSSNVDYEKMKSESERLKTFVGKWPLSNVNIVDLSHAGYFYTGHEDKVQCAFCRVVVGNLKVSSKLHGEYLKHFSWCDYISDKSKNVIAKVKKEPPWYHSLSQDVCGNIKLIDSSSSNASLANKLIDYNEEHSNLEDLGVHLHKDPVHPYYASLMARLGTFNSWPSNAPVSKEHLASAGFFHLGLNDRTVCFHCNGGLKKWEQGDDPWVEHARWFSACDFVRLNKGSDFIISCLLKTTSTILNENSELLDGFDSAESLLKKLDDSMKSNVVRNLADAGIFPPYILRAAILLQIKQTGCSFSNYDDLCVAASYLKEKLEKQYFEEKPVKAEDLNICLRISENLEISGTKAPNEVGQSVSNSIDLFHKESLEKGKSVVTGNSASPEKSTILDDEKEDHYLCKICMDKELGVVFLPCGHLPACTICAPALKHCPLCRKPIQATVRCYFH